MNLSESASVEPMNAAPQGAPLPVKREWLVIAVISLFALTMALSLFVPAFIEDILYLILNGRVGYDGWQSITPYPQCGPDSFVDIPLSLLPGRAVAWVAQLPINGIFALRMSGIILALAGLTYAAWFVKACILPAQSFTHIAAGVISATCLGTLPILMTSSRPEAGMFLAIAFYASLPLLVEKHAGPPRWIPPAAGLLFVLVTSWFFSAHPKALFYAPLALVSALSLRRWHKAAGWALAGAVLAASWQAAGFWQQRLVCNGSAAVRQFNAGEALPPSLLFNHPAMFMHKMLQDVLVAIVSASEVLFPINTWVVPHPPHSTIIAWIMGGVISFFIISLIVFTLRWLASGSALMINHAWKTRAWKHSSLPVALCLLAAALAQLLIQSDAKFTNFAFNWETLLLAGVITAHYLLRHTAYWDGKADWLGVLYQRLCTISILSQFVLLVVCIPATVATLRQASPYGEIQRDQEWYLISPLKYGQSKARILEAASLCRLAPDPSSRRIGVDTVTYLPFKETYQPLRLIFRFHDFDNPARFFAFLKQWQSSGVVTMCQSLPGKIRPFAHEQGGVCCISREDIENAPGATGR